MTFQEHKDYMAISVIFTIVIIIYTLPLTQLKNKNIGTNINIEEDQNILKK